MGLKIWLPLIDDIHNQGTSNATITNNGATVNTSGKIGSCYAFNGSNQYLYTNYKFYNTQYSVCAWIYSTSASATQTIVCDRTTVGYGFSIFLVGGKIRIDPGGNSIQWTTNYTYPTNTWFHLSITYNGTKVSYYINGEFKQEYTCALASNYWGNITSIGASQANGSNYGNYLNGRLNDVRIYDHCLSAAEVKEISQGLVLHYKLNQSNPNLISSDTFVNAPWATAIAAHEEYEGRLAYRLQCRTLYYNTSSGSINLFPDVIYQENTQYTLSITWRDDYRTDGKNSNLRIDIVYSDSTSTRIQSPSNSTHEWVHRVVTSTAGKTITKIRSTYGSSGYLYITDLKLEIGTLDTGMLYTDGSVQDSSGYNHNGVITGNITLNSDTPRYSLSSSFNGTERITTTTPGADIRTLSCWCKTTKNKSTSQHMVADSFSNMCISFYQGTIIGVFGSTRSTGSKSTLGDSYKENDWNHIVVVKTNDSGARDIYCNGVKLTPASNDYWSSATGFFVGARNTSNGNPFYGQISDVRAYCTALDADAIRQLYEVGAKIDNKNNIHAYEFNEFDTNKLTKSGVFKNTLNEETVSHAQVRDGNLYAENFIEA